MILYHYTSSSHEYSRKGQTERIEDAYIENKRIEIMDVLCTRIEMKHNDV